MSVEREERRTITLRAVLCAARKAALTAMQPLPPPTARLKRQRSGSADSDEPRGLVRRRRVDAGALNGERGIGWVCFPHPTAPGRLGHADWSVC